MVHGVLIHDVGSPEVLVWGEIAVGTPGPGEVRIKQRAVGLNFIDVYHRTGLYPLASLPAVIGMEGAGDVVELGPGVTSLTVGDRVAYAGVLGAYAEERIIAADRLVKLPAGISYETAAAMMLQGMTVRYLLRETYNVGPDTVLLFHAAAGGVGLIACQWARALGATLIGTVSTDEKAELARAHGAAHVIVTSREDFVARVHEITGGKGCDVVYDSVGKDTYRGSLDCLRPRGLFVSFGNASGPVPPFDLSLLKGSLFATRPSVMAYTATPAELAANAADLFQMVESGGVKIAVNQTFPLKDAAAAHAALEGRRTTGSTVLTI
ncbi:quinone oxidoreductase [Hyphomicrobium sp. CS1GBMeth3]|uniref:quinone oxidoreductase family protein n=1 Tax=Hyphomicrobium sp. CS1GBMeth3 TaxID=1892845 RepID=UPI00093129D8|nr:quinone oxidoreductase [Hyphomicrobium sp. CS1GBMeth3]